MRIFSADQRSAEFCPQFLNLLRKNYQAAIKNPANPKDLRGFCVETLQEKDLSLLQLLLKLVKFICAKKFAKRNTHAVAYHLDRDNFGIEASAI